MVRKLALILLIQLFLGLSISDYVPKTNHSGKLTPVATPYTDNNRIILFRIGMQDHSSQEFKRYGLHDANQIVLASGNPKETMINDFPKGLNASVNRNLSISFQMPNKLQYGAKFLVPIIEASTAIPQMSVFVNGFMAGLIQIAGLSDTNDSNYDAYGNLYELYIPPEFFIEGQNEIILQVERCLYCSSSEDPFLWFDWDYIEMEALYRMAEEPIHGRYIKMGSSVATERYYFDQSAVDHLPYVLKWMGIAYSGNIMRASCSSNVRNSCSAMQEYYEKLKEYNTGAVAMYLYTGDIQLTSAGTLAPEAASKLEQFMKRYGDYIQYYEVDNEPSIFNRSKDVNIAIARWMNENKTRYAPHLQSVAPGWSYSNKNGLPIGWERDPVQRRELENLTDLTNGHAYGTSYLEKEGGSFFETLKTFESLQNGLPKFMLNTEIGTNNKHLDPSKYGAQQKQSAVFDRNLRAHIGFSNIFMQHAVFFKDYELFQTDFQGKNHDPALTQAYSFGNDQESRLKIFRRLALAYATHGSPLSYEIMNRNEVRMKKVYIRAVDTAALQPLPGSKAVSDKILISIVNFEHEEIHLRFKVLMPDKGIFDGERIGPGDVYRDAVQQVNELKAEPWIEIEAVLPPGESIQYILDKR
ncbi:polysaccharide lyase family protein [Paenibacillus sp. tmac-D7]|uniref:polysaccharide lyase family protein n=1 Tax=Paenibacillus sp. tmac-D7 TaxID=2591462 RepID=UPI00114407F9|nr:polysaccharide lyase family protein [Paenibacillus sp. tmac-D7]